MTDNLAIMTMTFARIATPQTNAEQVTASITVYRRAPDKDERALVVKGDAIGEQVADFAVEQLKTAGTPHTVRRVRRQDPVTDKAAGRAQASIAIYRKTDANTEERFLVVETGSLGEAVSARAVELLTDAGIPHSVRRVRR